MGMRQLPAPRSECALNRTCSTPPANPNCRTSRLSPSSPGRLSCVGTAEASHLHVVPTQISRRFPPECGGLDRKKRVSKPRVETRQGQGCRRFSTRWLPRPLPKLLSRPTAVCMIDRRCSKRRLSLPGLHRAAPGRCPRRPGSTREHFLSLVRCYSPAPPPPLLPRRRRRGLRSEMYQVAARGDPCLLVAGRLCQEGTCCDSSSPARVPAPSRRTIAPSLPRSFLGGHSAALCLLAWCTQLATGGGG